MGFWDEATNQAGREFGARHWRWFAGARAARKVAPALSLLLIVGSVGAGLYLAYRWISPDWSAIGRSSADVALSGTWWVLGALIAAAVVTAVIAAVVKLWREYGWRLRLRWSRF